MFLTSLLNEIPILLLGLPAILISLSVHETAHGYVAYKLGDPTAKNLGRLTLNPLKHINLFGFICMLFFRVGWANPVPINTRYFKKPKRDMAITAAAGPLSNLCLAIIFTVLLRLVLIPLNSIAEGNYYYLGGINELVSIFEGVPNVSMIGENYAYASSINGNVLFLFLSLLSIMLFNGIILNISLMLFNLIPIPPFDGSRIAYIFLPTNLYFKVMQYERYIMIAFILLFSTGILSGFLNDAVISFINFFAKVTDMPIGLFNFVQQFVESLLPKFTF